MAAGSAGGRELDDMVRAQGSLADRRRAGGRRGQQQLEVQRRSRSKRMEGDDARGGRTDRSGGRGAGRQSFNAFSGWARRYGVVDQAEESGEANRVELARERERGKEARDGGMGWPGCIRLEEDDDQRKRARAENANRVWVKPEVVCRKASRTRRTAWCDIATPRELGWTCERTMTGGGSRVDGSCRLTSMIIISSSRS
jgi:hypothetical protein